MFNSWRIHIVKNFIRGSFDIALYKHVGDRSVEFVNGFQTRTISENEIPEDIERFPLQDEFVQQLMDDMWAMGIRPSNSKDIVQPMLISEMQNHSRDLKSIIDKVLELLPKHK